MNLNKFIPKKNLAQAMVEFAIVLPILLLLLYGLLEAGRLLFIYSTIVTASRQAVRYGAATGNGDGGIPGHDAGIPRYQDCAGIRAAAQRVDFLNSFDDVNIAIYHDHGPNDPAGITPLCGTQADGTVTDPPPPTDPNFNPSGSSERLLITIKGNFYPIVPKIVPFIARTVANGNPIRATSARTILYSVQIEMPNVSGPPGGPAQLTLSITPTPATYHASGELITYTYTVTNNGTATLNNVVIVDDKAGTITCAASLAPGTPTPCSSSGTYTIQPTDVPNPVTNTAHAEASDGTKSNDATATVTYAPPVVLSLTVNPSSATYLNAGDVITYTYTVTNSSAAALSNVVIVDSKAGTITCAASLNPGATTTCSGTYTIQPTDIPSDVTNSATAKASDGTTSAPAGATVRLAVPKLILTKTVSQTDSIVGDTVTYNFTLANSGNVDLTGVTISDPLLGGTVASCSNASLAVAAQITCSQNYVVNSANVVNGKITNTATASGTFSTASASSQSSATLNILTGALFLDVSVSPTSISSPQDITYTYTITNGTGKSLSGPYALTGSLSTALNNCFTGTLANGASQTCTATYHTQTDFDNAATSIQNNTIQVTACVANSNCNNQNLVKSNIVNATPVTVSGQSAGLTLQVTVSPTVATTLNQQVTYTYRLTNSGNVTLKQPFTLNDPTFGNITCSTADLLPGTSRDCTKPYNITQSDIDAGSIPSRQATASATYNSQPVSANAPVPAVTTFVGARLKLQITANPTTYPAPPALQTITYTYTLTNTGTSDLGGPFTVSSHESTGKTSLVSCNVDLLYSGHSIACGDSDQNVNGAVGTSITNTATAVDFTGTVKSNTATVTVSNPVPVCNNITATINPLAKDRTMTVAINNPNAYSVTISNIAVSWNAANGHKNGSNHKLVLQSAGFSGAPTPFWSGPSQSTSPATLVPSSNTIIPAGPSTIVFTFDQVYDQAGGEGITINLSTPGCENTPIKNP